jgi:hypothetical protein
MSILPIGTAPRGEVDVELQLVVGQHARELLLAFQAGDGGRDLERDAGAGQVLGAEGDGVHGEDADPPPGREQLVDERHQEQARRVPFPLQHAAQATKGSRSPAASRGTTRSGEAPSMRWYRAEKGKRERVADVAGDAREPGVEDQDADREPVLALAAADARQGCYCT